MIGTVAVPSYKDLLWPTLRAVREIGDSGTIEDIVEKLIEQEQLEKESMGSAYTDCRW
jgi:restriction system protein